MNEHQGHPAVERNAAFEPQALRRIGGERGIGLVRQQAGQDHARVRGEQPR